jgi:2-iminobutanoate/2-iminopropanoate deaminase
VLDNIEVETHRVLQNLQAILDASGSSLQQVLKATVFVKDMNMFSRINAVYGEYFKPEFAPARELVQVSELPKFVNVEISVIAELNSPV